MTTIASETHDWQLLTKKKNITVYSRPVAGTDHYAFRAVTDMQTTISELVDTHKNVKAMSKWLHTCYEPVLVEERNADSRIIYMKNSVPSWAILLKDRDLVIQQHFNIDRDKVTIKLDSIADILPINEKYVRIKKFDGKWEFTDNNDGTVKVVYEGLIDPGGNIPTYITNAMLEDGPIQSLEKLQKYQIRKR